MDTYTQVAQADPGTPPASDPTPAAPAAEATPTTPAEPPAAPAAEATPPAAPAGAPGAAPAAGPVTAVAPPTNGQNVDVNVQPGQVIDLQIQAATAVTLIQDGDTLVINFGPQGNIVLHDFFPAAASANPPVLQVGQDTQIPIGDIIAAIQAGEGALLEPAAGPAAPGPAAAAPVGGGFAVTPAAIAGLEGLSLVSLLPPTGLQFGLIEIEPTPFRTEEEGAEAPGFSGSAVTVVTPPPTDLPPPPDTPPGVNPPSPVIGTFPGGFEDWQPNQHLGDTTISKMQLVLDFTPSGSESITSLTISGLPDGAHFFIGNTEVAIVNGTVSGIPGGEIGNLYLLPPADSDADIPLTVVADLSDGNQVGTDFTAVVDAAADHPSVDADGTVDPRVCIDGEDAVATTTGHEQENVNLKIVAQFGDFTDGSETHTIVVSGVPTEWTLAGGAPAGVVASIGPDGKAIYTFTVTTADGKFDGTLVFNPNEWSSDHNGGPATIQVYAVAEEVNLSGSELSFNNNTSVVADSVTFTIIEDTPEFQPSAEANNSIVDEAALPDGASTPVAGASDTGSISVQFFTDGGADAKVTFSTETITQLDALQLTSCQAEIHYILSTDGTTIVGYTGTVVTSIDQITPDSKIFTLTIDQNPSSSVDSCGDEIKTYTYTFDLQGTLTHGSSGKDTLDLPFSFTATDSDSDSTTGSFIVTVVDDVPNASDTSLVHDETAGIQTADGAQDVTVNAALVAAAVAAAGMPLTALGAAETVPAFDTGAEALRDIAFSGVATGDATGATTSVGDLPIIYVVVDSHLILGVTGYDAGTGSYTGVAFSMHLDSAASFEAGTGHFTFIQYEAIESPVAGDLALGAADPVPAGSFNEGLGEGTLQVGYTVTDCDGDTASAHLTVDVLDDGPQANSDTALVQEGDTGGVPNTVSGNVITALGGDEAANAPTVPSADSAADNGGADQIQAIIKIVSGSNVYELSADGLTVTKNGRALDADEGYDTGTGVLTLKSSLGGTLAIDLKGDGVGTYTYTAPEHLDHSTDILITPTNPIPAGIVITAFDDTGASSTVTTDTDTSEVRVFEGTIAAQTGFGVTSGDDGSPPGSETRFLEVNFTGNAGTSGSEALSFDFAQFLTDNGAESLKSITIDLGVFYSNEDNGSQVYNEVGKYELYDAAGNKVGESSFVADSVTGQYSLVINSDVGFTKVVLSALQGIGADGDGVSHDNSDFMVTGVTVTACVEQIDDTFTYTVQDGDGDTASANLTIGVTDGDVRNVGVPTPLPDSDNIVQESHLATGTAPNPPETAEGTLVGLDWGPDGPGSINLVLPNDVALALTSDGQALTYVSGYNAVTQVATLTALDHNNAEVFTLTIDTSGNYSFTLTGVLDHPIVDATGAADAITLPFTYTLKDSDACSDNDGKSGSLTVSVQDDGPIAVADTGHVNAGETLTVAAGDGVLANDTFGADGGSTVTGVGIGEAGTPDAANIGQPIQGTYGTLTLNADGSYTYTPNDGLTGSVEDKFTYLITDGDGDTATAVLTITTNTPPTITCEADAGASFTRQTFAHDYGSLLPFPAFLPEAQAFPGSVSPYGVPEATVVDHYTASISVTYVDSVAAFKNTLGYYIINADGSISDPQIIFPQASGDNNPLSLGLRTAVIDNGGAGFEKGTAVGFFLIQDGFTDNSTLLSQIANGTAAGHFEFVQSGGAQANIGEGSAPILVWIDDSTGTQTVIDNKIWHTAAAEAGLDLGGTHYDTLGLNDDTAVNGTTQHDLMGYAPGGTDTLRLTFEDASFNGVGAQNIVSDRDYNDLTFDIKFGEGVEYQVTSHFSLAFTIGDDSQSLGSMAVSVDNVQAGDQLVFSNSDYTLNGSNQVLYQGVATNITLVQVDATHWTFVADDPITGTAVQTFQDIANAVTLEPAGHDGISRDVTVTVTDTGGLSASTSHDFVVWNDPVQSGALQFDGTSGNDILVGLGNNQTISGGDGDDVLFGGTGANQTLDGGAGNDILVAGSGQDTMIWKLGDQGSVAVPAVDTVTEFTVGPAGDKLDIHELLSDYHANAGADIDNYVTAAKSGTNVTLSIHMNGAADGAATQQEIVLQNIAPDVSATSSHDIVAELQAKQNLIV